MILETALVFAEHIKTVLAPHCERIEIAGSVRRKKSSVHDLEIVCIPKKGNQKSSKTGSPAPVMPFIQIVSSWTKVKGQPWDKYTQRIVELNGEYITLDLFTAVPDNWGYIYAIRTGSADYSHHVLANGWVKKGYHGKDGFLFDRNNKIVPVPEEQTLFDLIEVPFCEPEKRNWPQ